MHQDATLINKLGYQKFENWPSLYWHEKRRLLLLVFVDDFKLAGPKQTLPSAWKAIAQHVEMSGPKPIGKFLGCLHRWGNHTIDGKPVRPIE